MPSAGFEPMTIGSESRCSPTLLMFRLGEWEGGGGGGLTQHFVACLNNRICVVFDICMEKL